MTTNETPNVVLANPAVRRVLNWVVGAAAIVVPAAAVLDAASPELDWSSIVAPATAVTSFLAGLLGLIVTTPNIPRPSPLTVTEQEADAARDAYQGRHEA